MAPADCPFCRKLADLGLLPADELIWQFPHSVALLGPWQIRHFEPAQIRQRLECRVRQLLGIACGIDATEIGELRQREFDKLRRLYRFWRHRLLRAHSPGPGNEQQARAAEAPPCSMTRNHWSSIEMASRMVNTSPHSL